MRRILLLFFCVCVMAAGVVANEDATTLLEARKGHTTKLQRTATDEEALETPPEELFSVVTYPTPIGAMSAYLAKAPAGGGKHPAILWITGGFPAGGVGESAWRPQPSENDQSAKAYRLAGLVLMYPAFRGSFGNPGKQESFYGEVDDILAAADDLAKVDYVDPQRIYLGGHSTGGTLAHEPRPTCVDAAPGLLA
jgi:dipeptidyl aminopeptidase/acylaminoacyl peptidase